MIFLAPRMNGLEISELTLLQRIASGDSEAPALLVDRYGPLIWSIVRGRMRADAAEDLVQEVFIALWKNAERFDPALSSEPTYVATIARRRVIDQGRRRGSRPQHEPLSESVPAETGAADPLEVADEARLALAAMEGLVPAQRQVLRMAVVDGLTHVEIAAATALPLGTVKSHVRRGLERVREALASSQELEP